jgi:methionyl-tRNA formyltransferase
MEEKSNLMSGKNLRIVFMGTPDFAAGVLQKLLDCSYQIVGVITAPDKPAGRGQQMHQSSVKVLAAKNGLTVLQPLNLKDEDFQSELRALQADLFIVVAFRMLPESVWSMPPLGTFNLHASLLPQYRGAAPINWAIINGEKETGVTTFFIEKEIDTGNIIEQNHTEIAPSMTAGELHDVLLELGAELVCSTVEKIASGTASVIDQSTLIHSKLKDAPKLYKETCRILFDRPAKETYDLIRGLSPYPTAWCKIQGIDQNVRQFKLYNASLTEITCQPHSTIMHHSEGLLFPCTDHYLLITELQPEGKRRMSYKDFLAGNTLEGCTISKD